MDQDSGDPRSEEAPSPSPPPKVDSRGDPGTTSHERLPPPMFPPGSRRRRVRRPPTPSPAPEDDVAGAGGIPDDAFISPDEPIQGGTGQEREAGTSPVAEDANLAESAFISPDEPIVRTSVPHAPEDYEEVIGGWDEDEDVLVTGIGDDPHLSDEDIQAIESFGDSHVADLFKALDRLTDAVRAKGEGGLKSTSDMTPFEISLRAYCVGYLAGRREEE